MNTINNSMVHMATEGLSVYKSATTNTSTENKAVIKQTAEPIIQNRSQVAQNIEQNLAEIREDSQQLQKMSEMVYGRKLQFNVNKELKQVVIAIVDQNTNQVIKEIPSEDMQKLKLRIRKAIGNLYNELV
ncbi:MAG: flagellar protein FlaG [Treponema sp.]|nr:flagellar protein FlaG [Spirochaetia bacterium]MDY2840325.1 flagellar protein FlaG [Treponema sp.]MDY5123708.1 flagellar protein FlaG [Treponema sp.]